MFSDDVVDDYTLLRTGLYSPEYQSTGYLIVVWSFKQQVLKLFQNTLLVIMILLATAVM